MSKSPSPRLSSPPPSLKRKRTEQTFAELEINVSAPEPPSKKARRLAKKSKKAAKPTSDIGVKAHDSVPSPDSDSANSENAIPEPPGASSKKRSKYGIWIGNLPFSANKESVTTFLTSYGSIELKDISRIHLPPPLTGSIPSKPPAQKHQNRGFAYIDFTNSGAQEAALELSETLFTGRRVLVKDANSFEGRPEKTSKTKDTQELGTTAGGTKPPSKRIWVGNLDFDTTENDLRAHFAPCGEVVYAFMATFEDSGKSKGYAWITFAEVEEAKRAVRGWVEMEADDNREDGEDESGGEDRKGAKRKKRERQKKPRKWWVNRLKGHTLRMEFAEDPSVRYQKRFGKGRQNGKEEQGAGSDKAIENMQPTNEPNNVQSQNTGPGMKANLHAGPRNPERGREHRGPHTERRERRKAEDARNIKPGAALAAAPRHTGAIVAGEGKKITFD